MDSANSNFDFDDLVLSVDGLDVEKAAAIYNKFGCLVVRGLMRAHIGAMKRDIMATVDAAISELNQAVAVPEGWKVPNGSLFLPAPEHYDRDKQIMTVGIDYSTSAAFLSAALNPAALDIVEGIIGPQVELFGRGQVLVKEPVGGHAKQLHQDSAYFEHRYGGPVAILSYVVDTNLENGALHVVPGSHRLGQLTHVDTFSHLGLDEGEWPWDAAVPIEGMAGDSIFFNVQTVHGSKPNFGDQPRPVFIIRYRHPNDFRIVSATSTSNRSEAEQRSSESTWADDEHGFMVRGFRNSISQGANRG
jgi:ectoine hydroxylase-related dioxygenase (phytanoyl-CoA dioxygenase family)